MGMDHERLHIETSAVLISQLPIDMVKKVDGWKLAPRTYGEITPPRDFLNNFFRQPAICNLY